MADTSETTPPGDAESGPGEFADLVDAPIVALGLSSSAAVALEQAIGVRTVRDLADNKVEPTPPVYRPAPRPVLADGRYDSYIRTVDRHRNQLTVDLVQVFQGQAARDAAIADGTAPDKAQYLGVYARNQNPRLRTLPLAQDLRLDLRGGDCEAPRNHQLTKLATDARSMSGSTHTYYFTLTVRGGAVHQVQEFLAINAC